MDYYQKNIEILQQKREKLYERYENCIQTGEWAYPCDDILTGEAKDGNIIFQVKREGQDVRLNSLYRPLQEAERWADQFSGDNILVNAMLFGFGNGMFPRALLKRLQQDAKLFIYEPSIEIFDTALHQSDLSDLLEDERVLLCFEDINPDEFNDLLRQNTHWTNLETQIVGHHTGYDTLFPEVYRDFLVSVKKTSQLVQVNKDTQAYFAEKMVPNMIENMVYLREGRIITDYVDVIPKDIPAIIVAAGPSLDKNIEQLRKAKGKAFILAVDTAMRHLIKHDIMPDAMVTLDAGKPFSYMNHPAIKDIPLFCILESNHEIMEFHEGIKIWFQGGSFLAEFFDRYGKGFVDYNPGGSVATAAFAICAALEFERIVFVGQDLAYQGDVTHAGGEVSTVLNEEKGIQMIEGIDGKPVKSRHDWIIYLDWFEESIREVEDKIQVIDATEGGAMIHGSQIMTLAEVIEQYCVREVDLDTMLRGQPPVFTPEEYRHACEELQGYATQLQEMERKAEWAAKKCKEALKLLDKDPKNVKLDRLHRAVLDTIGEISEYRIYNMVDIYMSQTANKYLSGVFVVTEDSHQDEINIYHSSQMIFQGIVEAVQALYPMFIEMTDKIGQ